MTFWIGVLLMSPLALFVSVAVTAGISGKEGEPWARSFVIIVWVLFVIGWCAMLTGHSAVIEELRKQIPEQSEVVEIKETAA